MKLQLLVFSIVITGSLLSCDPKGSKCKLTRDDSLSIYGIIKSQVNDTSIRKFFGKPGPKMTPINEATARAMHQEYLKNPLDIYYMEDEETYKRVRGFNIERTELEKIYEKGVNGARIYFGIADGEYRLILTAINASKGNHLTADEIFDDFYPCPTYCPKDQATSEVEKRSDLNWDGSKFRDFYYP